MQVNFAQLPSSSTTFSRVISSIWSLVGQLDLPFHQLFLDVNRIAKNITIIARSLEDDIAICILVCLRRVISIITQMRRIKEYVILQQNQINLIKQ